MSEQIEHIDEETAAIDGVFPQNRQDELEAHAKQFAYAAHAAANGDQGPLNRQRQDSAFDFGRNMDAGAETVYIARQLELIRKGAYEIKYTAMKSPDLVTYVTDTPRGVVTLTQKIFDIAGEPEIERDDSDQVPSIELKTTSVSMGFFNMVQSYSFTDQDAAEAMYVGMPLQATKASAVRTQMARKADTIAFYGHATANSIKGLLNTSGLNSYTVPTTGTGGSSLFKDKDPDAVDLDLNAAGDVIITATNEIEIPDTWLLPLDAYRNIATRRVGDGTSTTILNYFKANRDTPVTVMSTVKSQAANSAKWGGSGSAGTSRMLVYKNDKDHVEFQLPVPFFQGQPQYRGFRTTVFCMMRCGGVAWKLPKSAAYADNVS